MMKDKNIKRVNELLSRWLVQIRLNNAISLFDINRYAEGLAGKLLNNIFDYNLVNLNYKPGIDQGIDLGDRQLGIAFQVTTLTDARKIKYILQQFEKEHREYYRSGIRILILSLERSRINNLKRSRSLNEFAPDFEPRRDILGSEDLVQAIAQLYDTDRTRFNRVLDILEEEFADGEVPKRETVDQSDSANLDRSERGGISVKSYPAIILKGLTIDNIKCFDHIKLKFPEEESAKVIYVEIENMAANYAKWRLRELK
ncbi:MAG: SMEK domain-containing protein, partial [bacterium]|nr:SMEK domain-containing protein [bacterium]